MACSYIVQLLLLGVLYTLHGVHSRREREEDWGHHHDDDGDHNMEYDHDAVLGSRHDNEMFDSLPPREAKKRLEEIVDKMDLDSDGSISKEELTEWLTHSFADLNKEDADHKMKGLDKNKDSKISWNEYLDGVYGYSPDELEDMDKDKNKEVQGFYKEIQQDKERFHIADEDKDDQLSVEEYKAFLHPQEHPEMKEYELDRTLEDYDKDGDKQLSFQEYLGESKPSKKIELIDKENFDNYDIDKDGQLSREELRAWVVPEMKDSVQQEVEHLFTETDKNKDGALEKQEILDNYHFWVGSAATEYGDGMDFHDPEEL